jgi:hypothetical protein
VDPVPDPLLSENLLAPEIEPETSGILARHFEYQTTEAANFNLNFTG